MTSECHLGGLAGVGEGSKVVNNPEPTCTGEKPVLKNTLLSLLLASLFFLWLPWFFFLSFFLSLAQCIPIQPPIYLSRSFAFSFQEYVFTSSWHSSLVSLRKNDYVLSITSTNCLGQSFLLKNYFICMGFCLNVCLGTTCVLEEGLTDKCE